MRISFIGERGMKNAKAIMMQHGDQVIAIDWSASFGELPESVTEVIVSHAHPENIAGLKNKHLTMCVHMNKYSNKLLGKEDFPFRRKIFWRRTFYLGAVRVTPIPVIHSVQAPTSGFVFEVGDKKIAYFPDVLRIRSHDMPLLNNVDLYIGDGAVLDKDLVRKNNGRSIGHASIRTQLQWLQNAGVRKAVFLHFGPWAKSGNLKRLFEHLTQEFGVHARETYDGYHVVLGRKVALQRQLPGIMLTPPHAENIVKGLATVIVSSTPAPANYIGRPLPVFQENKLYGFVVLTKEEQLSTEEAKKLKHGITEEEWKSWFGSSDKVWVHHFTLKEVINPPREVRIAYKQAGSFFASWKPREASDVF